MNKCVDLNLRLIHLTLASAMLMAPIIAPLQAMADCPSDFNRDGVVDGNDLGALLGEWGSIPGCSETDRSGDGTVNGADLGTLLGNWGPCPTPVCRSTELYEFDAEAVCLSRCFIPIKVFVWGFIDDFEVGKGEAQLYFNLGEGGPLLELWSLAGPESFIDKMSGTLVYADPSGDIQTIYVNDTPTPMADAIDAAMKEAQENPSPSSWQPLTRVIVSMLALAETPQWACLMQANFSDEGREGGLAGNVPWYCRTWVYAAAAFVIAAARIAGCAFFFSVCVAGVTAYPIAGFFINCVFLTLTLCGGGTLVATPACLGLLYAYLCQ